MNWNLLICVILIYAAKLIKNLHFQLYEDHEKLLRATFNKQSGRQFDIPAQEQWKQFHYAIAR